MAKAGDKRRLAENSARLRTLKLLIVGANVSPPFSLACPNLSPPHPPSIRAQVIYIGTRFALQRQQVVSWYGGALALTTALYAFCYAGIAAALGKALI